MANGKRPFDIVIALLVLVLLSPVILLLALLTGWLIGRPIIFTQERPGKDGILFTIYKFRTMKDLRDKNGILLPDQYRMTAFGNYLRRFSLDELPELFNVLKGDMSLVGPRPLLSDYLPLYSETQRRRHEVKPGLTGWAQINGRNQLDWEDRFNLDIWYVDNQSFWLDIKISLITFIKVIKGTGVNQKENIPMEKFNGTKK